MERTLPDLTDRLDGLERSVRRLRLLSGVFSLLLVGLLGAGFAGGPTRLIPEIRIRRLLVVDHDGTVRASIGEDPAATDRISRAAGLILYDAKGNERGGFSTMADGSVVLGMDAPVSVGAPMRDRIGLKVMPDGSAYVMLIDNQTRAVAKLQSDGAGGGGVQVFKWDTSAKLVHIRTLVFDGDVRDSVSLGQ
jgi:hypothetical protein